MTDSDICNVIADSAGCDVYPSTRLDEIGIDDLDRIQIACDLEAELNRELPDGVEDKWITAQDVIDMVRANQP